MPRQKIIEWGRKLDAGVGHDSLLELSRRLGRLELQPQTAPADFREVLLEDLLSKHTALPVSTRQSKRVLALDVVVAVMTLVLLVGTFVWNLWFPDSTSEPGSAISPLAGGVTATPIGTAPQPTPTYTPEPFVGGGDDSYVRGLRNATFIGPLEMSIPGGNATAGQGWLELTLRPDGTSIVLWRYSLLHANCSNDSGRIRHEDYGWVMSAGFPTPVLIENGMFEFDYAGELKVSGQFTSPTEVIAEVEISTVGYPYGTENYFICDFGTWNWSAGVIVPTYSQFIIPRGIPE